MLELDDYSFQALPDLGTGLRYPPEGRDSVSTSLQSTHPDNVKLLRASFAKIILLYIHTQDFLLSDSHILFRAKVQPDSKLLFTQFADSLDEQVNGNVVMTKAALRDKFGLSEAQDPLPVMFSSSASDGPQAAEDQPLVLMHFRSDDETLTLYYATTILSRPTAENLLQQVKSTFNLASANPGLPLTSPLDLPRELLSAHEPPFSDRAHLSLRWLTANAKTRPDAVAHEIYTTNGLECEPELLTYGELNRRSNQLARWLLRIRAERGDSAEFMVALCRSRDAWFYIANAGIWKAGGCYVSIDTDLPPERKRYIASDSGALLVLTNEDQAPLFEDKAAVLDDPKVQAEIDTEDGDENVENADLDKLAYLLYTSGTTGTPKGCLLNHRGVYWAIEAMCAFPRSVTDPDKDKRLALASPAFDVHISEIVQSWALGIRLVSGQRYELLADLRSVVREKGITHLGMVPSMIEATLGGSDEEKVGVKYLVSGGEKMSDQLLKKWADRPGLILANFYGPTEATIGCTSRRVSPQDRKENIGKPFESCYAYIVDPASINTDAENPQDKMKLVPRGTPGELVVAGPLVGIGYHKLPEVTRKVFLEWPEKGMRTYRTGDLVRMLPDDTLEILGRIDTQIKLRGVRIEAEGVSNVLRSALPSDLQSDYDIHTLIATHPSLPSGSELLVSFIAPPNPAITFKQRRNETPPVLQDEDVRSIVKEMKRKAEDELAVYMRPGYIVPVGWMPLSLNGKAEGRVLKAVFGETDISLLAEIQGTSGKSSQKEERVEREPTEEEKKIIKVALKVLNRENDLRPTSNLFECGLDSLRFATLASELRKAFAPNFFVTAAELMAKPVIEDIAISISLDNAATVLSERHDRLKAFDSEWRALVESVFSPVDIEVILPPFPVQEGVLFMSQEEDESYVQHFMYRFAEGTSVEKVKDTWGGVQKRVEILRTVFVSDQTLVQVILKPDAVELPFHEHHHINFDTFNNWFLQHEARLVSKRINEDLTTPLWAVNIYVSSSSETYMVFSINHALYDGNAMPLIIREFRSVYLGQPLPEPVPLADVLALIPPPEDESTKEFYIRHFSSLDLRGRTIRRPTPESEPKWIQKTFDGVSLEDLQNRCQKSWKVTVQAFWSVAFALAGQNIFNWGGHDEAVFGMVRAGRSLPLDHIDDAICPLVSVVPTVVHLRASSNILQDTQDFVTESLKHESVSLGQVQRCLGLGGHGMVEVLLSCRWEDGSKRKEVVEHVGTSKARPEFIFAIEMVMNPVSDTLEARVAFTDPELKSKDVEDFLTQFEAIVEGLVLNDSQFNDLSLPVADSSPKSVVNGDAKTSHGEEPVDPRLESTIALHVAQFLHIESSSVHPTTSLTSLGLSSIKAVSLARSLKEHGVKISAVDIIQGDVIRAIARRAHTSSTKKDVDDSSEWLNGLKKGLEAELGDVRISGDDVVAITRCTALQSGMLAQTMNSSGQLYVHAFTFQLLPSTSLSRLRSAWQSAVEQLDILRTSFHFTASGQWAQAIHSAADFKWTHCECSDITGVAKDFITSLNFGDEKAFSRPPVHFCHVTIPDASSQGHNYLVLVLHHALYDGISLPKLFHRVRSLYHGHSLPKPPSFLSIADAILLQENGGTQFWVSKLASIRPSHFPRISQRDNGEVDAWRASLQLDLNASDIQRYCRRYHIHPQCLGQAAWGKVLAKRIGAPDVVFGQVISGRTVEDAEDVVGPVFNTIPSRASITKGLTNKQLVRGMQSWNTDGLPWQHASLRAIQRELGVPGLFDTLFLYQPHATVKIEKPLWEVLGKGDMQESKTQYAVNIELHEGEETFSVFASCSADALSHSSLVHLLRDFNNVFVELVKSPNAPALAPEDPIFSVLPSQSDDVDGVDNEAIIKSWTPDQQRLLQILVDFVNLPADSVTPSTYLVSIGIDSICAIQVASLAKKAGIRISPTQVARSATVKELLALVPHSKLENGYSAPMPMYANAILPKEIVANVLASLSHEIAEGIESVLPLASGMEWSLSAWQTKPTAFCYKITRDEGETSSTVSRRIREALKTLATKHQILRAFTAATGESSFRLALCVLPEYSFEVEERELGHVNELDAVRKQARKYTSTSIPVNKPPTRLALLHGQTASYLVLSLHHMQYDGWSLPLLMKDLEAFYSSDNITGIGGEVASFLQLFLRSSQVLQEQEKYWKRRFPASYERRLFPRLNNDRMKNSFLSTLRRLILKPAPSPSEHRPRTFVKLTGLVASLGNLQAKAQSHNLPLQSVLLACWAITQAKWSLSRSATFLLSHTGRSGDIPNLDVLAVPTCNYVPTHVEIDELEWNVVKVARYIQDDLLSRSPVVEQSCLADVSRWVGMPGEPITNVSVNVLRLPGKKVDEEKMRVFQPLKFPYAPITSDNSLIRDQPYPEIQHDCQVEIFFSPAEDSIGISIECVNQLLSQAQAEEVARHWGGLAGAF